MKKLLFFVLLLTLLTIVLLLPSTAEDMSLIGTWHTVSVLPPDTGADGKSGILMISYELNADGTGWSHRATWRYDEQVWERLPTTLFDWKADGGRLHYQPRGETSTSWNEDYVLTGDALILGNRMFNRTVVLPGAMAYPDDPDGPQVPQAHNSGVRGSVGTDIVGTWYQRQYSEYFEALTTTELFVSQDGTAVTEGVFGREDDDASNQNTSRAMPVRKNYGWHRAGEINYLAYNPRASVRRPVGLLGDCLWNADLGYFSRSRDAFVARIVSDGTINLYEIPNLSGPVLATISSLDDRLLVLGRTGDFAKVFVRMHDGVLRMGYVTDVQVELFPEWFDEESQYLERAAVYAEWSMLAELPEAASIAQAPAEPQVTDAVPEPALADVHAGEYLLIQPGETYLIANLGDRSAIEWEGSWAMGSYALYGQESRLLESQFRTNGFFGDMWLDKGSELLFTVHSDSQSPAGLHYDAQAFRVTAQTEAAFGVWEVQPGDTLQLLNVTADDQYLYTTNGDNHISFIAYKMDASMQATILDAEHNEGFAADSGHAIGGNSTLLVYVGEEALQALNLYAPSRLLREEPTASFEQRVRMILPGEQAVYENTASDPQFLSLYAPNGSTDLTYPDHNWALHTETAMPHTSLPVGMVLVSGVSVHIARPEYETLPVFVMGDFSSLRSGSSLSQLAIKRLEEGVVDDGVYTLFGGYSFALHYIREINEAPGFIISYGTKQWKEVVLALIQGAHNEESYATAYTNNPGRARRLLKTLVERVLDQQSKDDLQTWNDLAMRMKGIDDFMAAIKGENISREVFDQLEDYLTVLDYAVHFVRDYSTNMALLRLIGQALPPAPNHLQQTISGLMNDYRLKFLSDEFMNQLTAVVKKSVDMVTGLKFGAADSIIKAYFAQDQRLEGLDSVIGLSPIRHELIRAFQASAKRLQEGQSNPETIRDYVLLFNLCRELQILEYEAMLLHYKDDPWSPEAGFLESELHKLRKMTFYQYQQAGSFLPY